MSERKKRVWQKVKADFFPVLAILGVMQIADEHGWAVALTVIPLVVALIALSALLNPFIDRVVAYLIPNQTPNDRP